MRFNPHSFCIFLNLPENFILKTVRYLKKEKDHYFLLNEEKQIILETTFDQLEPCPPLHSSSGLWLVTIEKPVEGQVTIINDRVYVFDGSAYIKVGGP